MSAPHYEHINACAFDVEHCCFVVQKYDPSPAWDQNVLLQEQKLSAVEEKALLQCGIYIEILSRLNWGLPAIIWSRIFSLLVRYINV